MSQSVGVIFDMDGVLVDSAAAHQEAWQELGAEIGTPFSAERFHATFGQRNESIIPAWLGALPAERLQALAARKEALYRERVRRGAVRVYPGIPNLLCALRGRGVRVAVASSGPRANVGLLIEVMGAGACVDAVMAGEDVSEGKPHPEVFQRAAERLGLSSAACAVVEDSVHGVVAAKRAGMLAVAVLTSTPRAELAAAGADLIVGTVSDLPIGALLAALHQGA